MQGGWKIGLVLFIVGIALLIAGIREASVAARSSGEPEEITLQNLIARGAGGNANVILTNFTLGQNYVYQSKGMSWSGAWVPAEASRGIGNLPMRMGFGGVKALIYSTRAKNADELYQQCGVPKLRGLVTNGLMSLDGKAKQLLEQSYPGTDFGNCLIIHEGREPAGSLKKLLLIGGGGLSIVGGIGLTVSSFFAGRSQPVKRVKKKRPAKTTEDDDDIIEE